MLVRVESMSSGFIERSCYKNKLLIILINENVVKLHSEYLCLHNKLHKLVLFSALVGEASFIS